jgi:molecular chaperone Hsp33
LVSERGDVMTHIEIPTRNPATQSADDTILPFEVAALDLRGRVVRLGPAIDEILTRHDYPVPVAALLGEAVVLAVLFGSSLKFDGRFILQTQTDGPVRMLVVDFTTPGQVRACARFDKGRVAEAIAAGNTKVGALLGRGHLAMTVDQGGEMSRYQGVVALDGGSLEDAAHEYFLRSEQIPTRVRLAVAEELRASPEGARHHWRAGGIMLQFLPKSPQRVADLDPGDLPEGIEPATQDNAEEEAWVEGRSLMGTVEDIELIDPALSTEQLAYRLFHERGVRVFNTLNVHAQCSCSRDNVEAMLLSFSREDRDDMIENETISVTCEFCNETYIFDPQEIEAKGEAEPKVENS